MKKNKKELLFSLTKKDFEVQWFSGTGAGGQHRNKHQNCCRIYHPASGARGVGQTSRSREDNKKEAFRNLVESPLFKAWFNKKVYETLSEETIEEKVRKAVSPENIKVEVKVNGVWKAVEEVSQ